MTDEELPTGWSHESQDGPSEENKELLRNIEYTENCEDCVKAMKEKLEMECCECGGPSLEEELMFCFLVMDVIALFPSMQEENTGQIVRRRVYRSGMKMPSFCY